MSSDDGAVLTGAVKVDSIDVEDENIRPHLLSPEFFDAERHPEVRFRSTELAIDGDEVKLAGDLAIGGNTRSVTATGTIRGPIEVTGVGDKLALSLEAEDRPHRVRDGLADGAPRRRRCARQRGLTGRRAGTQQGVTMRVLAISGSVRADSLNTRLLRHVAEEAPRGFDIELYSALKSIPPYDEDDDTRDAAPAPSPSCARRSSAPTRS